MTGLKKVIKTIMQEQRRKMQFASYIRARTCTKICYTKPRNTKDITISGCVAFDYLVITHVCVYTHIYYFNYIYRCIWGLLNALLRSYIELPPQFPSLN